MIAKTITLLMQMTRNIQVLCRPQEMLPSHLYSGCPQGGSYKRVTEPRLFLTQLVDFKEMNAPVKTQEEQEAVHTTHCE